MHREPLGSDEDTDRIEPEEVAEAGDNAAYQTTVETTEHRPLGVVVSGLPLPLAGNPAGPAAPRPWWQFWSS